MLYYSVEEVEKFMQDVSAVKYVREVNGKCLKQDSVISVE